MMSKVTIISICCAVASLSGCGILMSGVSLSAIDYDKYEVSVVDGETAEAAALGCEWLATSAGGSTPAQTDICGMKPSQQPMARPRSSFLFIAHPSRSPVWRSRAASAASCESKKGQNLRYLESLRAGLPDSASSTPWSDPTASQSWKPRPN